jgi:Bacterial Ig-like domain (group 3)
MTPVLKRPYRILFVLVGSLVLFGAGVSTASAATVATQTTLKSSVAAPVAGQLVKLKSVVTESPGTGLPTGSVTFMDSATSLGSVALTNVNGSMTAILTVGLPAGTRSLVANYSGDGSNAASSSSPLLLPVAKAATTVVVGASPRTAAGAYLITGDVKITKPGAGIATGTATFTIDGGTPTPVTLDVNGHAHVNATFTVGTSHTVSIAYSGDPNFSASTGSLTFVARIAGGFIPLTPARVLDTRNGTGAPVGPVAAGGTAHLVVLGHGGIPAGGVSAVALNVTVTGPTGGGYVTVYADGTTKPTASNLNFTAGQTIPNLVVVPVGANGAVALFNGSTGTTQLVADVAGYYVTGTPTVPGAFGPLTSARVLDTRNGTGTTAGPVAASATVHLAVLGVGGIPAFGVSAVVLNVTVTGPTSGGFITVYPDAAPKPTASNLNYTRGRTIANLVVVPIGAHGSIALYNGSAGSTQLIADVAGYYVTGAATVSGAFGPLTSARILDTRNGTGAPVGAVSAGGTVHLAVLGVGGIPASGVSAVVLNVTVTSPTRSGVITVYPDATTRPTASNLNFTPGETIPNLVVVPVGADGSIALYNGSAGTTQLIADVAGYYLQ